MEVHCKGRNYFLSQNSLNILAFICSYFANHLELSNVIFDGPRAMSVIDYSIHVKPGTQQYVENIWRISFYTYKLISLWKSFSGSTASLLESPCETDSTAFGIGSNVTSSLSTQASCCLKSDRHCFKPSYEREAQLRAMRHTNSTSSLAKVNIQVTK